MDNLEKSLLYSEELEIALGQKSDEEIFKWFLASVLLETGHKNTATGIPRIADIRIKTYFL